MSLELLAGDFLTVDLLASEFLDSDWAYGGLFASAFAAATLLPTASEGLLLGLAATDRFNPWSLVFVASLGNVLGACVNWALGRWLARRAVPRRPGSRRILARALRWYRRWGAWSLLFSWLPVVGDPLTLAAGYLRLSFWRFLTPVALGKTGRYVLLLGLLDLATA